MRGVKSLVLLLATVVATTAMSGCFDNTIVLAGQGGDVGGGSKSKSIECLDGHGTISMGVQGGGSITIKVTDGDGSTVFSETFSGGGQEGEAQKITGAIGTWTLTVSTNGAFGGQYTVSLSC